MNRWTMLFAVMAIFSLIALGCSGGSTSPTEPATDLTNNGNTPGFGNDGQTTSQTHLWGYYDIYLDIENETAEVVVDHDAMFAANVVQFLNGNPANLGFHINSTPVGSGYVDVDIDVTLKHPIPGASQYNGYDVRGIFIGDGSGTLATNTDLKYAAAGIDQELMNADGYTRWFNHQEFNQSGLFGYTEGLVSSGGYNGTATMNPYKYFADFLTKSGDVWDFLTTTSGKGVFSSGQSNTRNYYLRFPNSKGIKFEYAVVANWQGEAPTDHPSNAHEAVAIDITDFSTLHYVSSTGGGNIIMDFSVFCWADQPSKIFIESNVLSSPHQLTTSEMTPIYTSGHYSTYHVVIPADDIDGLTGNELWIICQYDNLDYKSPAGNTNDAATEPVTACFRHNLTVADCLPTVADFISPNSGYAFGIHTATITCSILDSGTGIAAYLDLDASPAGGYDIAGTNITNVNLVAKTFDVDFDLTGADIGSYYVVVTNECSLTVASDDPIFEVKESPDILVSNHTDFPTSGQNGSMEHPYITIQSAIDASAEGDLIAVDYGNGTYPGVITFNNKSDRSLVALNWYTESGRPQVNSTTDRTLYITDSDNILFEGFKCLINNNQEIYADCYHSDNLIIRDCYFTGNSENWSIMCVYTALCNNFTIANNLIKQVNCSTSNSGEVYAIVNWGGYGDICRNEITELQNLNINDGLTMYGIYNDPDGGECNITNNLTHNIVPFHSSGGTPFNFIMVASSTSTFNNLIAFNTINRIDLTLDLYWMGPSGNAGAGITTIDTSPFQNFCHSNIVSNLPYVGGGETAGFWVQAAGAHHNCTFVTMYDFYPGSGAPGPGNIEANPKYVNDTSDPYDYHLDTGSPCIGTGDSGEDMGCYGNLAEGEVVGLLTPL